jgi:pyrimidine operon attenuation protein / uracil phosphoribosyltransferase
MANSTKILVLNSKQIQQKIDRMAYQILEDSLNEKEIVIAGIASRGYVLAKRLQSVLEKISTLKILLIEITLNKDSDHLEAETDIDVTKCKNKSIIIGDDVLNSGRTLVYGLGIFLNIPTKKIRTAVLVDRSHKLFPIATDYAGHTLSTITHEHISVVFSKKASEEAVYLS